MPNPSLSLRRFEFIALMAALMSMVALSIDAMLPALGIIGQDLNVANANDSQLIISSVFLGMAFGLIIYGPISDSFGRKNAIYLGIGIFLIGCLISIFAQDFNQMLLGRVLQGFGAAACRVITVAMMRDMFDGKEMAKNMSLIMMVFIMVPALAPSLGQLILLFANWHYIFVILFIFAFISCLWLCLRQPETLAQEKRIGFSFANIKRGMIETIKHAEARTYTLAAGIMFGAFVGYLSSSQQILQVQYETGDLFSIYFGILALAIGVSSFANSKLVMKISMQTLCLAALWVVFACSALFLLYINMVDDDPSLISFMIYMMSTFFCFGILFGNFNTLAVHSLGHIAGVATSVISTVQTLISVVVGTYIGQHYNGTVTPMVLGFIICSGVTLGLIIWLRHRTKNIEHIATLHK
ncbi:multidrug effflux MFS transporter [Bermanella sp. WJH001]|uniref:multidrug effflux MFS transporter n=1 Tax=Bermanella sp. WJH001 TaxID=3048005 RepID=UPI0024BDA4CD|nr:multidrug effflux MFS transporter [Bermanella sp. WJH001]MDJ1538608.1 multidrug effflux MFS transporter [Bermanella sp. WJH001]